MARYGFYELTHVNYIVMFIYFYVGMDANNARACHLNKINAEEKSKAHFESIFQLRKNR